MKERIFFLIYYKLNGIKYINRCVLRSGFNNLTSYFLFIFFISFYTLFAFKKFT